MTIINLEEFESKIDQDLVHYCGNYLQKIYPGYLWSVRAEGTPGQAVICFTLVELFQYGVENVMTINPRDRDSVFEYERMIKQLGGELLERAKLARDRSHNVAVESRPDGFHKKFDRTITETKIVIN